MDNPETSKPTSEGAFLSVNFSHLEKFNPGFGALDTIILMQYLIFKCDTNKGEWFQSTAEITQKLKIKRDRLDRILDIFSERGWLMVQAKGWQNRRHFRLDFARLNSTEFLTEFYNWKELKLTQRWEIQAVFAEFAQRQLERETVI